MTAIVWISRAFQLFPSCLAFHLPCDYHLSNLVSGRDFGIFDDTSPSLRGKQRATTTPVRQYHRCLFHSNNDNNEDENESELEDTDEPTPFIPTTAQDPRLFLTQRCIQSFMFLLASTRDLHTVGWLDNFTQPITINNYWEDEDSTPNPGVEDAFNENDKK